MSEKNRTAIIIALIGVLGPLVSAVVTKLTIASSGGQLTDLRQEVAAARGKVELVTAGISPGTIVAYGGPLARETLVKKGWLPCDGAKVDRRQYKALYDEIGTSWGTGDGVHTFNLPDLRGVFLRGVNEDRSDKFLDPDASSRSAANGSVNTGNQVGSFQTDQTGPHNHAFHRGLTAAFGTEGIAIAPGTKVDELSNSATGKIVAYDGKESRPKNAYVHFLIRF